MTAIYNSEQINELAAFFLTRDSFQSWTPTVTQLGSVTVTVNYARYLVLGPLAFTIGRLTVTGSGTAGNAIEIGGQPTALQTAHSGGSRDVIGTAVVLDSGTTRYEGALTATSPTVWRIQLDSQTSVLGSTPSFALAAGDEIGFLAAFERT